MALFQHGLSFQFKRYDVGVSRNISIGELCSKYNSGYLRKNSTVLLCWLAVHDLHGKNSKNFTILEYRQYPRQYCLDHWYMEMLGK